MGAPGMEALCEKPRLRRLLDHFSAVTDPREQWRVAYPLPEVLLLVVCGTIASCDDYDDILDWGEAGRGSSRLPAPLPALFSWHPLRGLAAHADEPRGSGGVLDLLHELGARDLAGRAPAGRHRRQDLAAQP